jgi:hypothetical protein
MRLENLKKSLEVFRDAVIQQAKLNLKGQNKVSSGNLYNSIKGSEVKVSANSIEFSIEMEDYGTFIDKGVNGKKSAYTTPYSYKDKMPPPSKLDKWIVKRGIAPRDKNGKFIDRKSLQFAIAKSIFNNGIKPSLFFTKPFEEQYKKLEGQLDNILFRDAEEMIQFITKQNFKK